MSCAPLPTSRNNSSASIESWTRAAPAGSRRGSEDEGQIYHNPVVQAYIQAKMALFDRALYLQVNSSWSFSQGRTLFSDWQACKQCIFESHWELTRHVPCSAWVTNPELFPSPPYQMDTKARISLSHDMSPDQQRNPEEDATTLHSDRRHELSNPRVESSDWLVDSRHTTWYQLHSQRKKKPIQPSREFIHFFSTLFPPALELYSSYLTI